MGTALEIGGVADDVVKTAICKRAGGGCVSRYHLKTNAIAGGVAAGQIGIFGQHLNPRHADPRHPHSQTQGGRPHAAAKVQNAVPRARTATGGQQHWVNPGAIACTWAVQSAPARPEMRQLW